MGIPFPGEPSRFDRLLGEFEIAPTAETLAAAVARVPSTVLAAERPGL